MDRMPVLAALGAAVLQFTATGASRAEFHPDAQLKPIIIEASSEKDPTPGSKAGVYPTAARKAAVEGAAILRCNIQAEAHFGDCKVLEEYPADAGFSDVALAIAPHIQQPIPNSRGGGIRTSGTALIPFQFMILENDAKSLGNRVVWERKPSDVEMTSAYPFIAAQEDVGGLALIECRVATGGALSQCRGLREAPYGWGFREAALKVMSFFKAGPILKDGGALPNDGIVRVPVTFVVPFNPYRKPERPKPNLP